MPLTFLAPAFLLGLAALAVPLWLHLTRRESRDATPFPSLMFLRRAPHPVVRRKRVRDLPLLLLRCAALALVALAFARPLLDRSAAPAAAAERGGRDVAILLDRSASMGYGDRWQRARDEVRSVIQGLGPADRASLIVFDDEAEQSVPSTPEPDLLRAALDGVRPGSGATRYATALGAASSTLTRSVAPRREVVLISDFQRTGWDRDAVLPALPPGATLRTVSVAEEQAGNAAVTGVQFQREQRAGRERVAATARVVHQAAVARSAAATLEVAGRPVETRTVDLPASGAATVDFAPITLEPGAETRATVRLAEDSLAADNAFHFVLSPDDGVGVLVLQGPAAGEEGSLYLERALAIGDAPRFRVLVRGGELRPADLERRSVVVLHGAPFPAGAAGERLREWVAAGGGVILTHGAVGGAAADLFPGAAGPAREGESGAAAALGYLAFDHPVFEPFRAPRGGDFAAARFHWRRPLRMEDGAGVLARFGDGTVALAERPLGRGRVVAWAAGLGASDTDFPLKPVFLPFVHRLVRYAAGYQPDPAWATVGQPLDPASRLLRDGTLVLARSPAGASIGLRGDTPPLLREQGFYELRGRPDGAVPTRAVAVNLDPRESDLATFDPQELVAALAPGPGAAAAAPAAAAGATAETRERRQAAWWYLLLGTALLLGGEALLANRGSGAGRKAAGGATGRG